MDQNRLKSFLAYRQGLTCAPSKLSPAEVLSRYGWARGVGGHNAYISLYIRAGIVKLESEDAYRSRSIVESACARGCTYFLPQEHAQVGIKCGQGFNEASTYRSAKSKFGFTESNLEQLCEDILIGLERGPLDSSQLRDALGDKVIHWGEEGKTAGLTTSLAIGLLWLQSRAKIRRIPKNGTLDTQSYCYEIYENAPIVDDRFTKDDAYKVLANWYWDWTGFATLAHFQWFCGLSKKAAFEAAHPLGLIEAQNGLLAKESTIAEFDKFEDYPDGFRFVSSLDNLVHLRRDLSLHMEDDLLRLIGNLRYGLADSPFNLLLQNSEIVGFWEYDLESKQIEFQSTFATNSVQFRQEYDRMVHLIRDQLKDARSFSLDGLNYRRKTLEKLRLLSLNYSNSSN